MRSMLAENPVPGRLHADTRSRPPRSAPSGHKLRPGSRAGNPPSAALARRFVMGQAHRQVCPCAEDPYPAAGLQSSFEAAASAPARGAGVNGRNPVSGGARTLDEEVNRTGLERPMQLACEPGRIGPQPTRPEPQLPTLFLQAP